MGIFLPQGAPALFFSCSHAAVPSICKVIHFTGRTRSQPEQDVLRLAQPVENAQICRQPRTARVRASFRSSILETIRAQAASPVMLMVVRPMSKSRSMPATRAMPSMGILTL